MIERATVIVFVLQHSHQLDGGDETKLIGVYSSLSCAKEARQRLRLQPGFKDYPEGFAVDAYELDVYRGGLISDRR